MKTMTPEERADRLAEIIIPEGVDRRGRTSKIETAFGKKTREGLSAMILEGMEETPLGQELRSTLTHAAKLLAKWHNWIASGQLAFKPEDLEESRAVLRALGLPAMDREPVSPPPAADSEPSNQDRAARAREILEAYAAKTGITGDSLESTLGDLLADFRHLCAQGLEMDYEQANLMSEAHFSEESEEG